MRALLVGYFFAATALAGFPVWAAYRLQERFRRAWLLSYTFFLASWGVLVLLSVLQYLLLGRFLPDAAWGLTVAATRPLFAVALAVALYFLSSFVAQLTGSRLSRTYKVAYAAVWAAVSIAVSVGAMLVGEGPPAVLPAAASLAIFVLKAGTMYGWVVYGLWSIRRIDDPLDRSGLRGFLLLLSGGFLAFDLAVRNVTAVLGLHTSDFAIALVQVGANYPALWWVARHLRHRALARPAEPLPADLKTDLVGLGLSAREADVVELLLSGLTHKEIAGRLSIAPETVKKHTYNAHRKLGVQNRVQLSYLIQNRVARRVWTKAD